MKFYRLQDTTSKLTELRQKGTTKGVSCGFTTLDDYFTLKKGYPIFIAGAPFSGKTEFTLEVLLNTSLRYGWKHFIYTGEAGDVEYIFAELISKFCQKPFEKNNNFAMTESEKTQAEMFINEHFIVANIDNDYTVAGFLDTVLEAEKEFNINFDTTLFDPFNDIKDELELYGGREDKYLADALKQIRISSKNNKRIDILINHIADVRAVADKDTGNRYMPPALPNEWAGGRTWWRRGFQMLLIYRPPTFLKNENGEPFEANETQIFIQKSKPKGVGKLGVVSLFWDWKKNRYYEKSATGNVYESNRIFRDITEPIKNEYPF